MDDLIFSYRRKLSTIAVAGAFFGVGTAFITARAINNDRALVINGIIHLSVDHATTLYWCVATVSACITLFACVSAIICLFTDSKRAIRLTGDRIVLPQGILKQTFQEIPYRTIGDLRVVNVNRQAFIRIDHAGGKAWIARAMVDSDAEFANIGRSIAGRVGGTQR